MEDDISYSSGGNKDQKHNTLALNEYSNGTQRFTIMLMFNIQQTSKLNNKVIQYAQTAKGTTF